MIGLEQIRQLEGKISKAIDLIRVLKEENSTLRKGLDSAQARMRELESMVEAFKTDQREIESVIVRTLKNLDEMEENSAAAPASRKAEAPRETPGVQPSAQSLSKPAAAAQVSPSWHAGASAAAPASRKAEAPRVAAGAASEPAVSESGKNELDIF